MQLKQTMNELNLISFPDGLNLYSLQFQIYVNNDTLDSTELRIILAIKFNLFSIHGNHTKIIYLIMKLIDR